MATDYFGGTISFSVDRYEQVLSALNLLVSRDAKIVVGMSSEKGGVATLPFGIKDERGLALPFMNGSAAVDELKEVFEGCDLKCVPLKPSVANAKHLELAKELEGVGEMLPFSMADITPRVVAQAGFEGAALAVDAMGKEGSAAEDPFASFVGLDGQIRVFREMAATVKAYGRASLESLNVVLTGDPGTGKSSVAQAFARYAKQEGLVNGPFRQVSAENLIAKYAGQTPSLVKDQWLRAKGGIFLLDEAYRLSQDSGGFGREALNTLNELMERDRDTLVICAGYRKEMDGFMEANPGLAHRFAFYVDFPNYDDEVLERIFLGFARKKGFEVGATVRETLPEAFRRLRADVHFANGRSVRKLFDKCVIKQACYCGGGRTLCYEALELALAESEPAPVACRVGFTG